VNLWSVKLPLQSIQLSKNPLVDYLDERFKLYVVRLRRFAATADNLRLHSGAKVGEYRARTGDLLVANQALSQLS
jgi:hypothetical protein